VYNMTPYLPYHPGGEPELLRVAGKDGSKLFGEVHPWVNWEGMLEGCLIGVAVAEEEIKQPAPLDEMD
jgi:cytochrome b involved in lipid metabolism